MASFKALAKRAPVYITAHFTAGEAADKQIFTADRDYLIQEIIETHVTAGAASSTLSVEKTASGTAPASGTDVVDAAFLLDSTANTPVFKNTANGGVLTSASTNVLSRGDSLSLDFSGTVTAYEGVVTFVLIPVGTN